MRQAATLKVAAPGQQAYTTPGNYMFTVPAGVTSVSMVCVGGGGGGGNSGQYTPPGSGGGGGGLAYVNNVSVTPLSSLIVYVGVGGYGGYSGGGDSYIANATQSVVYAMATGGTLGTSSAGGTGGAYFYTTGYNGGNAANSNGNGTGGGGAAGYFANGGAGGQQFAAGASSTGSGGGGGGGGNTFFSNSFNYRFEYYGCGGLGGGVSIIGSGSNGSGGAAGTSANSLTVDGSAGGNGGDSSPYAGAGAGGQGVYRLIDTDYETQLDWMPTGNSNGNPGAVRIIWGAGRSYPSNAANV